MTSAIVAMVAFTGCGDDKNEDPQPQNLLDIRDSFVAMYTGSLCETWMEDNELYEDCYENTIIIVDKNPEKNDCLDIILVEDGEKETLFTAKLTESEEAYGVTIAQGTISSQKSPALEESIYGIQLDESDNEEYSIFFGPNLKTSEYTLVFMFGVAGSFSGEITNEKYVFMGEKIQ